MNCARERFVYAIAFAALYAVPVPAAHAQRDDSSGVATAQITYVSGNSVYIDAGANQGLGVGALLDVVRGGTSVARLEVKFVSPTRAQCEVVAGPETPVIGDTVRYVRVAVSPPAAPDTGTTVSRPARGPAAASAVSPRRRRLHGRVGLRYLVVRQADSGGASLTQPAADVRLDGPLPRIRFVELALDVRARRTRAVMIDGVEASPRSATLVYQSSLAVLGPGGVRLRVGRQYSTELAAVSLFDGVALEVARRHFGAGVFAGSQPDYETMGYSSQVREYGTYVALRPGSAAAMTIGAVSSYDGGEVNRDFGFVAASWHGTRGSLYARQEVDYNRGWRRSVDTSSLTPTSTYAGMRVRANDVLSLQGGYDTRRSVRLYRDYLTPDIAFDDSFRTGVWAGVLADLSRASASIDFRRSTGGPVDTTAAGSRAADVVTFTASVRGLFRSPFDLRERSSWFRSPAADGSLHSFSIAYQPAGVMNIEATGGIRRDTPLAGTAAAAIAPALTVRWLEVDVDFAIARSWYLMLSLSRERGGWEGSDYVYSTLSYRF